MASDPGLISDCKVGEEINGCDHQHIRFNIKMKFLLMENNVQIEIIKKANFNLTQQLLPPAGWDQINLTNVETIWTNFKS